MSGRAEMHQSPALPLVRPLPAGVTATGVFRALATRQRVVFFDSAMSHAELGRYSFVAADPFAWITLPADGSPGLTQLAGLLRPFESVRMPGLPPFQGGAAGLLSYDLARSLERIPTCRWDEFQLPALAVGLYDVVFAFDHQEECGWIISQGFPEIEESARRARADARLEEMLALVSMAPSPHHDTPSEPLDREKLAPQFEIPGHPFVTSNMSRASYLEAVARGVEYVHAGDVFQVNLAQRLLCPAQSDPLSLYLRLRERNAATFAGFFDLGEAQVVSASPERFLQVASGVVETRPIKGTRPRLARPEADLFAGDELSASEKDRAENIMIVDLMRNDLARVCEPQSVEVTRLCQLETYAYVQHLVSVVKGKLREEASPIEVLKGAFPGGSITGAPKVRAMEIISELEPTARGPYCGSLFYLGFDGTMDSNILIRTITASRGWWQFPVGGGIVADSDPRREYEETWHKATGLLRALVP